MPNIPAVPFDVHKFDTRVTQSICGGQDWLRWDSASTAAAPAGGLNVNAPQAGALSGRRLIDLAADIAAGYYTALGPGTYYVKFPMNGMASINVYLTATFSGGTVTTSAYSTMKDEATQSQAFTGTGAMTTNTLQTATLSTPKGEQFAVVQIVVGSGASVTAFTLAEYAGQRG